MKTKIILVSVIVFWAVHLYAQPQSIVKVAENSADKMRLVVSTGELTASRQELYGIAFSQLHIEGFGPSQEVGLPCLPTMVRLLEVPLCKGFDIKVQHVVADTLPLAQLGVSAPVAPLQPSRSKSDTSRPYLVQQVEAYARDEFMGTATVSVEAIGVARSQNLARLVLSPVRYNAVRGELIVVRTMEIEIAYRQPDIEATMRIARLHASPMFASTATLNGAFESNEQSELVRSAMAEHRLAEQNGTFEQGDGFQLKDAASNAPVRYLIVAHSSFRGELDTFMAWKRRKGFITDIVYTGDAGVGTTAQSIAAYVKLQYTNATRSLPAPTFLLLVGDVEQIPAFDGEYAYAFESHVTDLYYATWTDGDLLPDCYYGRFSAQDVEQLVPQIEKTLMYEQYTFADPTFLDNAVMVAGIDGATSSDNAYTYGDPAMDYAVSTYINGDAGFASVVYYKNNTANVPAAANVAVRYNGGTNYEAQANALRGLYSAGAGWINYTAHGDIGEWSMPSFRTSDVSDMTNRQKFGFMIGNCCLSNSFDAATCLGEALLRRGDYCGAVAYIGATNSTYWSEDFYWSVGLRSNISNTMNTVYDGANLGMYDRLVHSHGEPRALHCTSAGAMMMAGNMAVESSSSERKAYYWEVYNLMGDPSVMPWLARPVAGVLQAGGSLVCGSTTLAVTTAPYAYVALTEGSEHRLVAAAFANGQGQATLIFESISVGNYELVVTAQNRTPVFMHLTAVVPEGPYEVVTGMAVSDVGQLSLGTEIEPWQLPAGDTVFFDISIANIGTAACDSARVSLRCDAEVLLPLHSSVVVGRVGAGDTLVFSGCAAAKVWSHTPEGTATRITAVVDFVAGGDTLRSMTNHEFAVVAPRLVRRGVGFSRSSIAPGDTVVASITYRNEGSLSFRPASVDVVPLTQRVAAECGRQYTFRAGAEQTIELQLVLSRQLPASLLYPLPLVMTDGSYLFRDTVYMQIGESVTEDFETGGFNHFPWRNGTYPWQITRVPSEVHDGMFSARSCNFSGDEARNKSSELTLVWSSPVDDSIAYWRRVSSEEHYDEFIFSIDGVEKERVSGELRWQRVAFAVPAGTHTFKFAYSKDWSHSDGSDCVWIDNVKLPSAGTVYRYTVDSVCQGEPYMFGGVNVASALRPGTYHFADTTAANLEQWLTLTVGRPINLMLTPADTTIELGQPVTLSASGAEQYRWNKGYTVPTLMLYPTGRVNSYVVTGRSGGCSDTRQVTVTVRGATEGMAPEPVQCLGLKAFPNPARDVINVEIEGLSLTASWVRLYDMQGRLVAVPCRGSGTGVQIGVQGLSRGLYLLQVATPDKVYLKKIIVN